MRTPLRHLCALSISTLPLGCGAPTEAPRSTATPTTGGIECPAPIGHIRAESCGEIADDFGALSVSGSLKIAGSTKDAELRVAAIRAAGGLANALKEARVDLCEDFNHCHVDPKTHGERDQRLADLMGALIKLWNGRRFTDQGEAQHFADGVATLRADLDRVLGTTSTTPIATPAQTHAVVSKGESLKHVDGPGLTFASDAGTVTVAAAEGGARDVLVTRVEALPLVAGKRYLLQVVGSYTPATPALLAAGEDVHVRLKYRATKPSDLWIALRSLEDLDLPDGATTFHLAASAKGSEDATLTPPLGSSGYYVGIGARGAAVEIDDVEIVRGDKTIASARAESPTEPFVKTTCAISSTEALAGKASLRCEPGEADALTLGLPASQLYVAVRGPSGERTRLRTTSLEGGRSLDVTLTEAGELVVGMIGAGKATIQSVTASEIVAPKKD